MGWLQAIQLFFGIGEMASGAPGQAYQQPKTTPAWLVILALLTIIGIVIFAVKRK